MNRRRSCLRDELERGRIGKRLAFENWRRRLALECAGHAGGAGLSVRVDEAALYEAIGRGID